MRLLFLLLLVTPAMAGCLDGESIFSGNSLRDCKDPQEFTWYLGPDLVLQTDMPPEGRRAGNGFDEAFLTNNLDEWMGPTADRTWRIEGDVQLTFWTQGINTPAPIVIGGDPGEGYHFFNQFGTNRGFVESYAIEYATALPDEEIRRYDEVFTMPEGGILVEAGDHVRLLLTNLVLDDPNSGRGPNILFGGDTPSALSYTAACEPTSRWSLVESSVSTVGIPLHQGLLTGAVPATEGLNYADVPLVLHPDTERLTIAIDGTGGLDALAKSDIDLSVLDSNGDESWSIGSPYTDEVGTRWWRTLDAVMPPGDYTVRVNSYSGHGYNGQLSVLQEVRA